MKEPSPESLEAAHGSESHFLRRHIGKIVVGALTTGALIYGYVDAVQDSIARTEDFIEGKDPGELVKNMVTNATSDSGD